MKARFYMDSGLVYDYLGVNKPEIIDAFSAAVASGGVILGSDTVIVASKVTLIDFIEEETDE